MCSTAWAYINVKNTNTANITNKDIPQNAQIILYPNPASNTLYLQTKIKGTLFLYNTLGQAYSHSLVMGTNNIDISNLTNGYYYIQFITQQGNSSSATFIKQ